MTAYSCITTIRASSAPSSFLLPCAPTWALGFLVPEILYFQSCLCLESFVFGSVAYCCGIHPHRYVLCYSIYFHLWILFGSLARLESVCVFTMYGHIHLLPNAGCQVSTSLCEHMISVLQGKHLQMELLAHMASICSPLQDVPTLLSKVDVALCIPIGKLHMHTGLTCRRGELEWLR